MYEPKNIRDLKCMYDTSKNCGEIEYIPTEDRKKSEWPSVGMESSRVVRVGITSENVIVNEYVYIIDKVCSPTNYSSMSKLDWSKSYTFDEFKNSEWWEKCMEKLSDGLTDSSWMDDWEFVVEERNVIVKLSIPVKTEYKGYKMCGLEIVVDRYSGCIDMNYDGKSTCFTPEEVIKTFAMVDLLSAKGIYINDDGIMVKLR